MPQPTVEEFWSLLVKSRLVDAGTVATFRRELAAGAAGGDVPGLARHLVERGLLSRWQAKRLAAGNLGPFFLGDYRLLERHDREGDALLFTARHEPSGRILSVVLLNAKRCREIEVWTEIVQRTTAASRTTDPMLSRTWSLEQHESGRLIVCEHVEGTSLAEELDRHGPLPAVQAGVLVSQIARAVADLHAAGGVHGNLSLDVLRREPAPGGVPRTGRVRLLQFPLAGDPHRVPLRPWDDAAELAALGTRAAYVAPELLLPGRACDPRCDVYAIGAILYALVSGSPPCRSGDAAATLRQAAFHGPEPLGPPAVSVELATLVGYLMARDPNERYQTAAEAADAVAGCLGLAAAATVAPPKRPAGGRQADAAAVNVGMPETGAGPIRSSRPAEGPPNPVRRRAARLQLIGAAITLAILAATAALMISRLARRPKPPPAVAAAPSPAPAQLPSSAPANAGVDGWGEALPNAAGVGQRVAPPDEAVDGAPARGA
ncbi:MAG: protein kinase domain-containing protein, partial [Planctomycetota bacterium]